jgi:hypothetical protein
LTPAAAWAQGAAVLIVTQTSTEARLAVYFAIRIIELLPQHEMRNPKPEIRNKSEAPNPN